MRRWWPILLLLVLGAGLHAQPALPQCKMAEKLASLEAGSLPDFTGCLVAEAGKALIAADYRPVPRIDVAASGIPQYKITRQTHDGREVFLWYSTGKGYPPAAPPPPVVNLQPVPAPPPPPPIEQPVHFSLEAPRSVVEGDSFELVVRRDRDDGRPHTLSLAFKPDGLVLNAPPSITFEGTTETATFMIGTAPGTPGDGDHRMVAAITGFDAGAAPGKVPRLTITVTDRRPAQSYSIAVQGEVRRASPITFTITRSDIADPGNPRFDITQDGTTIAGNQTTAFGDGESQWRFTLPADRISQCGSAVRLVLHAPGGDVPFAADFADQAPPSCGPAPTGTAGPEPCVENCGFHIPWDWIAILAVAGAAGIGIHKWWQSRPPPAPPTPPPPPPLPTVTAIGTLDLPANLPPFTLGERALRWPGGSVSAHVDSGETRLPDPLPVESDDNG